MQKEKDAQIALYANDKVHQKIRYNNVREWVKQ